MTIPMLLPSGLNIDLSTLEKHIEAERSWGRLPSDPFTGVLFSDDVKPLPNGALKARIDLYILSSGVDVKSCGRTVGTSRDKLFSSTCTQLQRTSLNEEFGNTLVNEERNCKNGRDEEFTAKKDNKIVAGQSMYNEKNIHVDVCVIGNDGHEHGEKGL
jgi:hypothetical protein